MLAWLAWLHLRIGDDLLQVNGQHKMNEETIQQPRHGIFQRVDVEVDFYLDIL
jgi:hypothetical protein